MIQRYFEIFKINHPLKFNKYKNIKYDYILNQLRRKNLSIQDVYVGGRVA